jgi:antitoxin MazE
MKAKIVKFGNSLGVRIPKSIANKLHFTKDSQINLEMSDNNLIISAASSDLDMMLNKISDKNLHKSLLDDDSSKGNEAW